MRAPILTLMCYLVLVITLGVTSLSGENEPITPTEIVPSPVTTSTPTVILKHFEGLLEKVQDRTPLVQDMAYNTLLSYIAHLSPTEIFQRINPQIKYKDLLLIPQRYRGAIIQAEGLLLYLRPYELDTNPAGIKIFYSGMIGDPGSDEYFKFHLIDKPTMPLITREESTEPDLVRIEGAFLKIESYQVDPTYGPGEAYAPFLIGRTITKLKIAPPAGVTQFKIVMVVVIILAFIFLVFMFFISARREKALKKRLQEIKEKHR